MEKSEMNAYIHYYCITLVSAISWFSALNSPTDLRLNICKFICCVFFCLLHFLLFDFMFFSFYLINVTDFSYMEVWTLQ